MLLLEPGYLLLVSFINKSDSSQQILVSPVSTLSTLHSSLDMLGDCYFIKPLLSENLHNDFRHDLWRWAGLVGTGYLLGFVLFCFGKAFNICLCFFSFDENQSQTVKELLPTFLHLMNVYFWVALVTEGCFFPTGFSATKLTSTDYGRGTLLTFVSYLASYKNSCDKNS